MRKNDRQRTAGIPRNYNLRGLHNRVPLRAVHTMPKCSSAVHTCNYDNVPIHVQCTRIPRSKFFFFGGCTCPGALYGLCAWTVALIYSYCTFQVYWFCCSSLLCFYDVWWVLWVEILQLAYMHSGTSVDDRCHADTSTFSWTPGCVLEIAASWRHAIIQWCSKMLHLEEDGSSSTSSREMQTRYLEEVTLSTSNTVWSSSMLWEAWGGRLFRKQVSAIARAWNNLFCLIGHVSDFSWFCSDIHQEWSDISSYMHVKLSTLHFLHKFCPDMKSN